MKGLVNQLGQEVGIRQACQALDVPRSWYYRQQGAEKASKQSNGNRPSPKHTLSEQEKEAVRTVLNSGRFMDQAPRQVYATLLDEGQYLCHWRTMYRILAEHDEVHERRTQRRHPSYVRPQLVARGANQVWSWDITWLAGTERGLFYYLYVILDLFSRYVVGWLVAEAESGQLAKTLIEQSCARQQINPSQLTLHADRGSPMRSKPVTQLLADLEVAQTHSRPYTSNDNPYSESQFKTMKYRPDYPQQFRCLEQARAWAQTFFDWYNQHHRHTRLGLMTPATVHGGQVTAIRQQRQQVLDVAYRTHPERFKAGPPEAPQLPAEVWINPPFQLPEVSPPPAGGEVRGNLESGESCRQLQSDQTHSLLDGLVSVNGREIYPISSNELSQSP